MSRLVVLAPSYDMMTERTNLAVCELKSRFDHFAWLLGDDAEMGQVEQLCHENSSSKVAILFAGHGCRYGLLTAPDLGEQMNTIEGDHSILLSSRALFPGKTYCVVAYCCKAGSEFGQRVADTGGLFIGYVGDLWLLPTHGIDCFLEALFGEILANVQDNGGVLPELAVAIKQVYERAIKAAAGQGIEKLSRMCLAHQLENLTIVGPEPRKSTGAILNVNPFVRPGLVQ